MGVAGLHLFNGARDGIDVRVCVRWVMVYILTGRAFAGFGNFMGVFQDATSETTGHGCGENGAKHGRERKLSVRKEGKDLYAMFLLQSE